MSSATSNLLGQKLNRIKLLQYCSKFRTRTRIYTRVQVTQVYFRRLRFRKQQVESSWVQLGRLTILMKVKVPISASRVQLGRSSLWDILHKTIALCKISQSLQSLVRFRIMRNSFLEQTYIKRKESGTSFQGMQTLYKLCANLYKFAGCSKRISNAPKPVQVSGICKHSIKPSTNHPTTRPHSLVSCSDSYNSKNCLISANSCLPFW